MVFKKERKIADQRIHSRFVATRKTDAASEIIVENDGPGFQAADNNEPHIALNNIRNKLDMMCGGTLTISLRKVGGAPVKVTIPLAKPKAKWIKPLQICSPGLR